MTREEQIKQKSLDVFPIKERDNKKATGSFDASFQKRKAFEWGAEWADAHPNPNTIKKIFEFALEKTNFLIADNLESIDWGVLIKKAMEE